MGIYGARIRLAVAIGCSDLLFHFADPNLAGC